MKLIVFSDLDGTLLDEDSYSFAAAEPALALMRRHRVPLVLATSKTRAEVEELRTRLDNRDPFIVENGGGIFFPRYGDFRRDGLHRDGHHPRDSGFPLDDRPPHDIAFPLGEGEANLADIHPVSAIDESGGYLRVTCGVGYETIHDFMRDTGARLGARGFGDMTDDEVASRTGLTLEEAHRARRREFTEPFLIDGEERLAELRREAARAGLAITRGGRFHHLVAVGQDKGAAVPLVVAVLSGGTNVRTAGLGDSDNDVGMLEAVDVAMVIPRPDGTHLRLGRDDVRYASVPGSGGWNEVVLHIVDEVCGAQG